MRYRTVLRSYELNIAKPAYAGKQIKLAYFSDLHGCASKREQEKLLDLLEHADPELVLCGGDAAVGTPGWDPLSTAGFLEKVASRRTLLLSVGNHELRLRLNTNKYGDLYARYTRLLAERGLCHLINESVDLTIDGMLFRIYGFDVPRGYYVHGSRPHMPLSELTGVFESPGDAPVTILLAHNPSALHTYLEWGADLTLCGHTHGGLMRLGSHRGFISPELFLFPSVAYGHFQKQGKHAIISSGCGEHTLPIRIFNPREIVALKLNFTA